MTVGQRRRAFFVIDSLGAERLFATLIGALETRFAACIELVLLDEFPEVHAVPASIVRHRLDCRRSMVTSVRRRIDRVRRERPDPIFGVATRADCAAVLAGAVCSEGFAADLADNYGVPVERLIAVDTPMGRDTILELETAVPSIDLSLEPWDAAGRLAPDENVPMLVRAFAASGVNVHLVIFGEGAEREALTTPVADLDPIGRVHLAGHVGNPHACTARVRASLSTSNAEGTPNALGGAWVLGRAVAVPDCDSGPSEIPRGRLLPKVDRICRSSMTCWCLPATSRRWPTHRVGSPILTNGRARRRRRRYEGAISISNTWSRRISASSRRRSSFPATRATETARRGGGRRPPSFLRSKA